MPTKSELITALAAANARADAAEAALKVERDKLRRETAEMRVARKRFLEAAAAKKPPASKAPPPPRYVPTGDSVLPSQGWETELNY